MKVVAFNGSPNKDGNTSILLNTVLNVLNAEGIETELIHIAGKKINGCISCFNCFKNKNKHCSVKSDMLNDYIDKMIDADGILIGSPTYFGNVTTEIKALIDRAGLVSMANDSMLKRKVGAGVVAVRRAGSVETFNSINSFFFLNQMIIPCSNYWNIAVGMEKGEVNNDKEGMSTMKTLGENMAWLLKKL